MLDIVRDLGQSSDRTEPIEISMNKSLVLVALVVSACSGEPPQPPLQQRIAELEQQNAQLQRDLQKARNDVEALKRIMNSNNSNSSGEGEVPDNEGTPGQPMAPQPSNNLGGATTPPAG